MLGRVGLHSMPCMFRVSARIHKAIPQPLEERQRVARKLGERESRAYLSVGCRLSVAYPAKNVQLPMKKYWAIAMAFSITKGGNVEL